MNKENMDWRLIDKMITWVKQDKHVNLSRPQALKILVKAKLVKPNGLPTRKIIRHNKKPINHEATTSVNHKVSYRQFIASVPASRIDYLKSHKDGMPTNKYVRAIQSLKDSENSILYTSLSQLNIQGWNDILQAGYRMYWILSKNNATPKDKEWLRSNFEHLVARFKKQADNKDQAEEAVRTIMVNIQSRL